MIRLQQNVLQIVYSADIVQVVQRRTEKLMLHVWESLWLLYEDERNIIITISNFHERHLGGMRERILRM